MNQWLIIAGLVSVCVAFIAGFDIGNSYAENKYREAQLKQLEKDSKAVEKLRDQTNKAEVIYRDRIKVVRETVDNCLSTRIAEPVISQLCDSKLCP